MPRRDTLLEISADEIFDGKIFGGQNFRQQARFSALLSPEILSDKSTLLSTSDVILMFPHGRPEINDARYSKERFQIFNLESESSCEISRQK